MVASGNGFFVPAAKDGSLYCMERVNTSYAGTVTILLIRASKRGKWTGS